VDLVRLRYFRTVAKTLHFRRAAALLNVSQPPLSKSIKTLEDQLGTQLFVRSRRHVELTPAGHALLERCERIFIANVDLLVSFIGTSLTALWSFLLAWLGRKGHKTLWSRT